MQNVEDAALTSCRQGQLMYLLWQGTINPFTPSVIASATSGFALGVLLYVA